MAGIFFEYFDGYLRIEFSRAGYGDLYMDITLHGDTTAAVPCDDNFVKGDPEISTRENATVRTWVSSNLCPINSLVAWLEAVVCGVQECAFEWDGEGTDGELRWFRHWDSGILKLSWSKDDNEHKMRLNRVQMVRAFYESFRGFVESERYDPLQYEELNAGECCTLVLEGDDLDALADALAARDRRGAERLLDAVLDLAFDHDAGYPRRATLDVFIERSNQSTAEVPDENRWFPKEWDTRNEQLRRQDVFDVIFPGGAGIGFGSRLRELRSPTIEAWLARQNENAQMARPGVTREQ